MSRIAKTVQAIVQPSLTAAAKQIRAGQRAVGSHIEPLAAADHGATSAVQPQATGRSPSPHATAAAEAAEKVGKWKNRVVLVAGANGNVGEQLVMRLAKKGVNLALAGRDGGPAIPLADLKAKVEKKGVKAAIFTPDLASASEGHKLVNDAVKHFGRLDGVVDLVAIYHHGSFVEHSPAHWEKMIDLNLKGGTALMQEAAKKLSHSDMGFYGHASSLAGQANIGNEIVYCQTKAARRSLTLSFAAEVASGQAKLPGPHTPAITVVSPSLIDSPMAEGRGFDLTRAIGSGDVADAFMYQMGQRGRTVTPEITLSSRRSPY